MKLITSCVYAVAIEKKMQVHNNDLEVRYKCNPHKNSEN